jgi:hypothetical protein
MWQVWAVHGRGGAGRAALVTDPQQAPEPSAEQTDIGPDDTDLDSDALPETSDPAAFEDDGTLGGLGGADGTAGGAG